MSVDANEIRAKLFPKPPQTVIDRRYKCNGIRQFEFYEALDAIPLRESSSR